MSARSGPGGAKRGPGEPQEPPGVPQESPRRVPRGQNKVPKRLPLQFLLSGREPSGKHLGSILAAFSALRKPPRHDFRAIFEALAKQLFANRFLLFSALLRLFLDPLAGLEQERETLLPESAGEGAQRPSKAPSKTPSLLS